VVDANVPTYFVYHPLAFMTSATFLGIEIYNAYHPAHMRWARTAIRGLTYLVTGKGPQRREIGKTDVPTCICDGWTPQNAVHVFQCPWIGDGIGRLWERAHEDEEWCAAVARFIC